jgi:hypothetical protein
MPGSLARELEDGEDNLKAPEDWLSPKAGARSSAKRLGLRQSPGAFWSQRHYRLAKVPPRAQITVCRLTGKQVNAPRIVRHL